MVTQCLERVASAGTGSATGSYFPYPRAGKTGTTENGWDVWYAGYTPQLAAAVWMGDTEKNSPMHGAYGGDYCAPMWAKFFAAALKDQPHPSFKTFPWTFGDWESKYSAGRRPRRRARRSPSAKPSPGADQDHHADAAADQDATPKPTPTKTKPTPTPTPTTPTGTPTAAPRQVIQALTTPSTRRGSWWRPTLRRAPGARRAPATRVWPAPPCTGSPACSDSDLRGRMTRAARPPQVRRAVRRPRPQEPCRLRAVRHRSS